jgi:exodeoxyribonuclease V alpha subunit
MTDVRLVQRAGGLLRTFNAAGVLAPADVHVALRLSTLGREKDERVLLAAALAVRAVRLGSVCVELSRLSDVSVDEPDVDVAALPWPAVADVDAALRASPLVNGPLVGALTPLRLVDTDDGALLYLDRYWRQEQTVRTVLEAREATRPPAVDRARMAQLFDGPAPDRQRIGAALAATRWTTVLAGGPGTGKTHTVARVLALLHEPGLRVALAAPTGKAAARLEEAVREQAAGLGLPDLPAMTLHRLLGWRPDSSSRFKHDAGNRLPYDVVVLDESSMVSLTMMARLLEALRPDTRLLLVGDPDQLTSVDAGAVLADVVARPGSPSVDPALAQLVAADLDATDDPDEAALSDGERARLGAGVVRLSRGRRFGGAIAELAVAVRSGDADRALELLHAGDPRLSFTGADDVDAVRADVTTASAAVTAAAAAGDVTGALAHLEDHRLLCAHRTARSGCTSGIAGRGSGRRAARRLVPRTAVAGHGQRPRGEGLQRRHRRGGRRRRCPHGGLRPGRRARPARACAARVGGDGARDDHPPQPGQSVPHRVGRAAAGRVVAAQPRAALHRRHPRHRARARARHGRGAARRRRAAGAAGERAAAAGARGDRRLTLRSAPTLGACWRWDGDGATSPRRRTSSSRR